MELDTVGANAALSARGKWTTVEGLGASSKKCQHGVWAPPRLVATPSSIRLQKAWTLEPGIDVSARDIYRDVETRLITYTVVGSAYEKDGHWQLLLALLRKLPERS